MAVTNSHRSTSRAAAAASLLVCVAALQFAALASIATAAEPSSRPNVVFILTDDQRWDTIGPSGRSVLKTPHIDRLAAEGLYFRNAFCTTSLCSPSRASILSGLYAHSHGVSNNFTEYPADLPSFPRQLQQAGYETAYIGKYHMGEENDEKRPGFDYFVTHKGQGKYFDTEFNINGERREVVQGYYTHVVTDMAEKWLRTAAAGDQPFLLMLGHKAPHSFYFPEPKYEHAFDDVPIEYPATAFHARRQAGVVPEAARHLARHLRPAVRLAQEIPRPLPRGGEGFRGDDAGLLGHDSLGRRQRRPAVRAAEGTRPARQHADSFSPPTTASSTASTAWSTSGRCTSRAFACRWSCAIRDSSRRTRRARSPQQVLTLDFAPTILDICGAPALPKTHGASWKKLAQGDDRDWRKSWYYEYNYEKQFPYTPNVRGVRTDRCKYIRYPHGDGSPDRHKAELYDLEADPDETTNLAARP